ncbi:hypothetical protein BDZ89DRAFT_170572 [Hymenopellis radicata]|nr:hypothetical protein BDZ89DRAFT_170572 [Hymenopellis radicata]
MLSTTAPLGRTGWFYTTMLRCSLMITISSSTASCSVPHRNHVPTSTRHSSRSAITSGRSHQPCQCPTSSDPVVPNCLRKCTTSFPP